MAVAVAGNREQDVAKGGRVLGEVRQLMGVHAVDGEQVLTVPEAARYLRLSVSTVYRLLHRGVLPGVKVGNSWRIPVDALSEYLRAGQGGRRPQEAVGGGK